MNLDESLNLGFVNATLAFYDENKSKIFYFCNHDRRSRHVGRIEFTWEVLTLAASGPLESTDRRSNF
jgi:hypothetical protein